MKVCLTFALIACFSASAYASSDSVFHAIKSGLIPEHSIIIPEGKGYIHEKYTFFKGLYWLEARDTLDHLAIEKHEMGFRMNEDKRSLLYFKRGICDSLVNHIRNSASYFQMQSEINREASAKIGNNNKAFKEYRFSGKTRIDNFEELCQESYQKKEAGIRETLIGKINAIRGSKLSRLEYLNEKEPAIGVQQVEELLATFDPVEPDYRSLALVIRIEPEIFREVIDSLPEGDFYTFTLQLDKFPPDIELNELKQILSKKGVKNRRTKKVKRKMKNSDNLS